MLWKCCIQYASKFWKFSSGQRAVKDHFSLQSQRKAMSKSVKTTALNSHSGKKFIKILEEMLQHYINQELPDVQAVFRKGRRSRDQIANICWIIEKAREFQKNIYYWLCGWQQTGKFLKEWKYQTTLPASWEIYMQVKNQQLEPAMKQWTGSKLERSMSKLCIVALLI